MTDRPTGYEPLYTLKEFAPDVWIVDGPAVKFFGIPFPTRMTVVRLSDGALWIHSPVRIGGELGAAVSALGPVRFLIAPNWLHFTWVSDWQSAFPDSRTFVSPGVVKRAAASGVTLHFDASLENQPPEQWAGEIDQQVIDCGPHREVVFFHRSSRTLILTDLIENFEPRHMPPWTRPLLHIAGICAPNGGMPRDMKLSFLRHCKEFSRQIKQMISWQPERIILSHGKCFDRHAVAELKRVFRRFL